MAMKEGLIGRKRGMTQVFGDDGNRIAVTVVEAGPCTVVGVRTKASHGYDALQLGFGVAKKKHLTKAMAGHFKKAGVATPMRMLREIRLQKTENVAAYQVGQILSVELFSPGELVDVVGVSKGKGFQGGVKRHGWAGGDADSRLHVSSSARLDWRVVRSVPGLAGPSSPGAHGGRAYHRAQSARRASAAEQNLLLLARRRARTDRRASSIVRKSVKQTKAQQQKAKEAK